MSLLKNIVVFMKDRVRGLSAFLTVGLLAAVLASPASAQGVSAADLLEPVTAGVNSAIIGGFVIAAAILVAFAIYKIVKRFA